MRREELVPESMEPAATIRRVDQLDDMRRAVSRSGTPPRPSRPSTSGAEDAETAAVLPKDFSKALAQLDEQRRRASGTPSQTPPPVKSGSWDSQRDALAQLQKNRENGAPAPPPPPKSNPGDVNRSVFANPAPATQRMEGPREARPDPQKMRPEPPPSPRRLASVPPTAQVKDDLPSARDLAKNVQSRAPAAPPPTPSSPALENTTPQGGPSLLQSLVVVPPGPSSSTAPLGGAPNTLNLKPGTGAPLAPMRTPNPMAIVGGSSLRINSPDKPMPVGPQPPRASASNPPPPNPSRPPTAPKGFAPSAGGPPVQYERAFRQWSSPAIIQPEETNDPLAASPAVSFQVYTPRDIGAGRGPMRSIPPPDAQAAKKSSLGARIAMSVVGGVIVLLTALAVIAVSTEDPKKPAQPLPSAKPTISAQVEPPPPPPTAITISDDDVPVPATTTTTTAKPRPKSTAASTGSAAPPSSLKQIAPPPNPYGNK